MKNVRTGQEYAFGGYLWRLYYDASYEKEIQITAGEQKPEVSGKDDRIVITYRNLTAHGLTLNIQAVMEVILENDKVRFASTLHNGEEHWKKRARVTP